MLLSLWFAFLATLPSVKSYYYYSGDYNYSDYFMDYSPVPAPGGTPGGTVEGAQEGFDPIPTQCSKGPEYTRPTNPNVKVNLDIEKGPTEVLNAKTKKDIYDKNRRPNTAYAKKHKPNLAADKIFLRLVVNSVGGVNDIKQEMELAIDEQRSWIDKRLAYDTGDADDALCIVGSGTGKKTNLDMDYYTYEVSPKKN